MSATKRSATLLFTEKSSWYYSLNALNGLKKRKKRLLFKQKLLMWSVVFSNLWVWGCSIHYSGFGDVWVLMFCHFFLFFLEWTQYHLLLGIYETNNWWSGSIDITKLLRYINDSYNPSSQMQWGFLANRRKYFQGYYFCQVDNTENNVSRYTYWFYSFSPLDI